jgi:AraC-like DNA-binding protein
LRGTVYWGIPDEEDARQLTRTLELDRDGRAFDVVTDGRRMEAVPPAAFEVLAAYIRTRLPHYARCFRRHVLVHPPGLLGTVMTGFYPMLGPEHTARPFPDAAQGYSWLNRPDGMETLAEVEALVARVRGVPPIVQSLQDYFAVNPSVADIDVVARTLGLSARSLQRRLSDHKTTFREEVGLARVAMAKQLLAGSDVKLAAISARLGYASRAHFASLFQRATGESPGRFRERMQRSQVERGR